LALEFYLAKRPGIPGKTSDEILALSELLNRLGAKLGTTTPDRYRNPNGVYMKLMNFRRFDPDYQGKGLVRGGKDEAIIWERYFSKPRELYEAASAVRAFVQSAEMPSAHPDTKKSHKGEPLIDARNPAARG